MKETLIVKDFGPIKDVELDLRKTTVFIGPQGSGKSTLAKLIAIFRDWGFLKQYNTLHRTGEKGVGYMNFFQHYNIHNFFKFIPETAFHKTFFSHTCENHWVNFDKDRFIIGFEDEMKEKIEKIEESKRRLILEAEKFNKLKASTKLDNDKETFNIIISDYMNKFQENIADLFKYKENSSKYIPTERFLISAISESLLSLVNGNISLPKCFTQFGTDFENARKQISTLDIPFLKIAYKYENGLDRVLTKENEIINLSESASGFQALIPLQMVIEYFILQNSHDYSFIIEEPELNLYPTTQKDLIYYLSDKCTKGENDLVITTHSPYTLSSFNNLLLAYQTAQKHPEQKEAIKAIIPEESWMNPEDFAAYYVESDGTARSIFNRKTGMIGENELDDVSETIGEEFDELMEIYRSPTLKT